MRPYLEPGFLACLLLRAPARREADRLIRGFTPPYRLHRWHLLQIEQMLLKSERSIEEDAREAAADGRRLWRQYWLENVFELHEAPFENGLALAIDLLPKAANGTLSPMMCFHAGMARTSGATHFLSFHPSYRVAAQLAGLPVLPA